MHQLKTLTVNGTTYEVASVVPATSVTLLAKSWVDSGEAYSQVVTVPGATPHTKVDLQPTAAQLAEFNHKVLAFVAENDTGVVTVYAVGDKPTSDHTIQTTLTEVEASGKIRGNTVGTPTPRTDFNQTDPAKADYLHGREKIVQTVNGVAPDENGNVNVTVPGSGGNVDLTGYVKSVNGIAPDKNGNVVLPGGSGESGGVTSWNDLTDKPFYTGDPVETEVFNLSTALFQDDEPVWEQQEQIDDTTYLWRSYPYALGKVFEVGKEYTVVIDGVEHKTTAIDGTTVDGQPGPEVALGDTEFFGTDSVPETFKYAIIEIDAFEDTYFNIFYKGESAPKEFRVLGIKPEIVKIDPKYLPDGGVGYVTDGEYGVLRECTVEITGIGDDVWGDEYKILSSNLVLAAGETYRVTVNGVVYERVAYHDPDDATIILVGGDSDSFKLQSQHGWIYFYPEENGTYTVKLEGKPAPVYHKIDPRFLPDDIVTGEDLDNVLEEVQTMIDAAGGSGGGGLSRDEVQTMIDTALGVIENGTY